MSFLTRKKNRIYSEMKSQVTNLLLELLLRHTIQKLEVNDHNPKLFILANGGTQTKFTVSELTYLVH
jgi:hypothetical protein